MKYRNIIYRIIHVEIALPYFLYRTVHENELTLL